MFNIKASFIATIVASVSYALPGSSPLCDVNGAGDKIAGSAMGANAQDLSGVMTFAADNEDLSPGNTITVTATGGAFQGFLMYAVGDDGVTPVGSFATDIGGIPAQANPSDQCAQFSPEVPESVICHTQGQQYADGSAFVYTVPQAGVTNGLQFNAIVMQDLGGGQFGWGVFPGAVTIGNVAGQQQGGIATSPDQGIPPPNKGVQNVEANNCQQAPPTTVTEYVTMAPVVKVRKCVPKSWQMNAPVQKGAPVFNDPVQGNPVQQGINLDGPQLGVAADDGSGNIAAGVDGASNLSGY